MNGLKSPTFELPSEMGQMPWKKFRARSVSASSIGEYWFCSAKVVNAALLGEVETEEAIIGSGYHEKVATQIIQKLGPLQRVEVESVRDIMNLSRDNILDAIERREILANSDEDILFWAISPELKYVGVPDKADCTDGIPVLMDFKTTNRLPGEAWTNHRIQLGAYMIGIEKLGFQQEYGIVRYVLRQDPATIADLRVFLDGYLRDEVVTTARAVHSIVFGGVEPRPTTNPNKCAKCPYNDVCRWSLVKPKEKIR